MFRWQDRELITLESIRPHLHDHCFVRLEQSYSVGILYFRYDLRTGDSIPMIKIQGFMPQEFTEEHVLRRVEYKYRSNKDTLKESMIKYLKQYGTASFLSFMGDVYKIYQGVKHVKKD